MVELFFSTSNSSKIKEGIEAAIDELIGLGIQNIEIYSGHQFEQNFSEKLLYYKKKGVRFLLHNHSPPNEQPILINLSNTNKKERGEVINFIKKRIDITKELEADYFSFHGGFRVADYSFNEYNHNKKLISYDKAFSLFVSGLKEIVSYAESKSCNVGFENHVVVMGDEEKLITYQPEEIELVLKLINSKNLYFHLDVGHLNVTSHTIGLNKATFIKKFADSVFAIHLHSNNNLMDEHQFIHKDCWILPYLKQFSHLKYIIFETKGPLTKEIANSMKKYVVGALQ